MHPPDNVVTEITMTTISEIISDASEYVKEGLVEKWQRWIILIILMIVQSVTFYIVPLFNGYLVRVYGTKEGSAPELDDYKRLFVDGWKLNIVAILYMIPAIIIAIILGFLSVLPVITSIMNKGRIDELLGVIIGSFGLMVAGLVVAIISLIMYMAFVHFSRTGSIMDAFSVGAIVKQITDGIGWGTYIIMWIIVWIFSMILFVIIMGLSVVPPLGIIAGLVLAPIWAVFIAKINCNIYDNRP
jgi:MFS family permease